MAQNHRPARLHTAAAARTTEGFAETSARFVGACINITGQARSLTRAKDRGQIASMRTFALAALLLTACGMPFKYQVYELAPQHTDVLWIYKGGALWRCWHDGHPVCETATMHDQRTDTGPTTPAAQSAVPKGAYFPDYTK